MIINTLAKAEITSPRPIKFLIFICAIVGELFVTGFFYDSDSTTSVTDSSTAFLSNAVVYSIAATLLMIPLKIIISLFLSGAELNETMTRQEIEAAQKKTGPRKVGMILGYSWVAACLYGIMMYILSFSAFALDNWLITFGAAIFNEALVMEQLKILAKVLISILLMKLAKTKFMLTGAGIMASKAVDCMFKTF